MSLNRKTLPIVIIFVCSNYLVLLAQTNQWVQTNGPMNKKVVSIVIDTNNYIYAGTSVDGVYLSTNRGDLWTQVLPNKKINSLAINSQNHIYAATAYDGLFKSTDNGKNWVSLGLADWNIKSLYLLPNNLVYAGMLAQAGHTSAIGQLIRSYDGGSTWPDKIFNDIVYFVTVNKSGHIFIVGDAGQHVYRSMDNGNNFTYKGKSPYGDWMTSIVFNSKNNILYTSASGIYLSSDNSDSWVKINDSTYYESLLINKSQHIYAVSRGGSGISYSKNDGVTWTQNNDGLTDLELYSMAIDSFGIIYIGTGKSGVFRTQFSTTSVHQSNVSLPSNITLDQNYPNPFNPSTIISYQLPLATHISLKVYNILGQEVAILVNGYNELGRYSVTFETSKLSAGMYIYVLSTDKLVVGKKMLLVK